MNHLDARPPSPRHDDRCGFLIGVAEVTFGALARPNSDTTGNHRTALTIGGRFLAASPLRPHPSAHRHLGRRIPAQVGRVTALRRRNLSYLFNLAAIDSIEGRWLWTNYC